MSKQPVQVDIDQEHLLIKWSDGDQTRHSMAHLRKHCPCATCRVEREKLEGKGPVLRVISGPVPQEQQARILEFSPVGRYALSFVWNDRHSTGIYTYDFLLENQE